MLHAHHISQKMAEIKGITDYSLSRPLLDKKYRTFIPNINLWLNSIPIGRDGLSFNLVYTRWKI